jgi:hypothetical protein
VGGSELDEICDPDFFLSCKVSKVAAYALEAYILGVCAFVGEDQGAVTGSVEAVVESSANGCAGSIGALAVCEKLCSKGGGDLVPYWWASRLGCLGWSFAEHVADPVEEIADSSL